LICVNAWQNPVLEGLASNGLVEADIHGNVNATHVMGSPIRSRKMDSKGSAFGGVIGPKGRLLYLPARLRRDGQSPWPYWPSVKPEIRWC
jgi:hypothetical protein